MKAAQSMEISQSSDLYPHRLMQRLAEKAPAQLSCLGNADLLKLPKTAIFCSARCPGDAILRTYDQAARWRDDCRCIISGFHSPVEKECLRILLRGKPPVIVCVARSLPTRLPSEWMQPLSGGRLLLLSFFSGKVKRVTAELAVYRNEVVAALADDVWFAHIREGGQMEKLDRRVRDWS